MSRRLANIEQLDALRAIAAISIIVFHFLIDTELGSFSFGWIGVDLFFVISGFLITLILLEQKETVPKKLRIIGSFVVRRGLRLFPAYYLLIILFLILKYTTTIQAWDTGEGKFYYTYLQNMLFYREGMKGILLNHLWSLAVEEQFYLLWPWLLLYLPNRFLLAALVLLIPSCLLFKSLTTIPEFRMLIFAHIDTLGTGALMALLLKEGKEQALLFIHKIKWILILSSLFVLILSTITTIPLVFISLAVLLLSVGFVTGTYYSFGGIGGFLFNSRTLAYLGKISYGLYLYHKPIPTLLKILSGDMLDPSTIMGLSVILTFILAYLSFCFLEKPFLKLKAKFDL